jgi:hypothetical protein
VGDFDTQSIGLPVDEDLVERSSLIDETRRSVDRSCDTNSDSTESDRSEGSNEDSTIADSISEDVDFADVSHQALQTLIDQFPRMLGQWILKNHVSEKATASLLYILKLFPDLGGLPSCRKTLVKTPGGKVDVKIMEPGIYFHFGVVSGLVESLLKTSTELDNGTELKLQVGIDGVSLANSSDATFWPIAAKVTNLENTEVYMIGVYQGPSKPEHVNEFLKEFVQDLITLAEEGGIIFEGKLYPVKLDALICDTPAKAYVLQTLGHTGFLSCFRCDIAGKKSKTFKKTFFPTKSGNVRSEADFRDRNQPGHHIGDSIIEDIPDFKITEQVPYDFMHLILLGVLKKNFGCLFSSVKKETSPIHFQGSRRFDSYAT